MTYVISLGGSLIVPNGLPATPEQSSSLRWRAGGIDVAFLKKFKNVIAKEVKNGNRFFIVVGGGKIARHYQDAAKAVGLLAPDDVDWLGIHSTRLNGHLIRTVFRQWAYPKIITSPNDLKDLHMAYSVSRIANSRNNKLYAISNKRYAIVVAAGWRPGFSTDGVAAEIARHVRAGAIINLTNVDYVYNKDPKHNGAKAFKALSWNQFFRIIGNAKHKPGGHYPFDPVASRIAFKAGVSVVIMKGTNLKNLEAYFAGKRFNGTVISRD